MSGTLGPPISFALLSLLPFFSLPPVPLHSWKRSNAVRRQSPPRLHCRFYQRAEAKFDPRARFWTDKRRHVRAVGPVLLSISVRRRRVRCKGVKRWSSHCFSGLSCSEALLSCSAWDNSLSSLAMWLTIWPFVGHESEFWWGISFRNTH